MTRHRSAFLKGRAIGMWEVGNTSMRQVSQRVGVAVQTVCDWKSRYMAEGNVTRRRGSGRPQQTTKRSDRLLVCLTKKHRLSSAQALPRQWKECVSRRTVCRRLLEKQLHSYPPTLCPKLTRHHIEKRLQWYMAKLAWQLPTWKRMVLTDESKFCLLSTDRKSVVKAWWRLLLEDIGSGESGFLRRFSPGVGSYLAWQMKYTAWD